MILLSSIINEFKDRFLDRYKNYVLPSHKKTLQAMVQCRQEHGPHMLAQCTDHNCGKQIYIPHSCGHRNCPHCQNHENQQWIDNQLSKRLPTQYYLITFTLPEQSVPGRHSGTGYPAMRKRHGHLQVSPCQDRAIQKRTVTGEYFLYLLMLHVLPKGFRRTRCYGFLHLCSKKLILFLQMVLRVNPLSMFVRKLKERPTITCPVCGAVIKIIMTKIPKPPTRQADCLT